MSGNKTNPARLRSLSLIPGLLHGTLKGRARREMTGEMRGERRGEMVAWWLVVLAGWLSLCVSGQNNFAEEIPGEAGLDYPPLTNVPDTPFSCLNRVNGGYYADVDTGCQVRRERPRSHN